jgi:uncharacterized BrkB/YihY/UPF0761 family membrane protein
MKVLWLNRKRLIILGIIALLGLVGGIYLGFVGHGIAVGIKYIVGIPSATAPLMLCLIKFGLIGLLIPTGITLLIFYLKFLRKNYKHRSVERKN